MNMAEKKKPSKLQRFLASLVKNKSTLNPDGNPYDVLPADQMQQLSDITTSGFNPTSTTENYNTNLSDATDTSMAAYNNGSVTRRDQDVADDPIVPQPRPPIMPMAIESDYMTTPLYTTPKQIIAVSRSGSRSFAVQGQDQQGHVQGHQIDERRDDSVINPVAVTNTNVAKKYLPKYGNLEADKVSVRDNEYTSLEQQQQQLRCRPPNIDQNTTNLPDLPTYHQPVTLVRSNGYSVPYIHGRATLKQPPGNIQNYLNILCIQRELATIIVGPIGGTFPLLNSNVAADSTTQFDDVIVTVPELCFTEDTKLYFMRSRNTDDFPPNIPYNRHRSDVIHVLPHGKTFPIPITVRIPLYGGIMRSTDGTPLKLMYSDSNSGEKNPSWISLQNTSGRLPTHTNTNYANSPQWAFADGCLFLFVSHFCMFLVVDALTEETFTFTPLVASLRVKYNPRTKVMSAKIEFDDKMSIDEDGEDIVQDENFMFCLNNENVLVNLDTDDKWTVMDRSNRTKEVSYLQLSHLQTLAKKPNVIFHLKYNDVHNEDIGVWMTIKIHQSNCSEIPVNIRVYPFCLSDITRSDRPEVLGGCCSLLSNQSQVSSTKQNKQPDNDELLSSALSHIVEKYYALPNNPIPDIKTQDTLAQILDPRDSWRLIAIEMGVDLDTTHVLNHNSPTKCLLHVYGLRGDACNWEVFCDKLKCLKHHDAAHVLEEWNCNRTELKPIYFV